MTDDPPVILGADGQPASAAEPAPRPKLTDREPLSDIQARLRQETGERRRGGKMRRQV